MRRIGFARPLLLNVNNQPRPDVLADAVEEDAVVRGRTDVLPQVKTLNHARHIRRFTLGVSKSIGDSVYFNRVQHSCCKKHAGVVEVLVFNERLVDALTNFNYPQV